MSDALKPVFFPNVPALEESGVKGDPTPEEMSLYSLSRSRGWKTFRGIANQVIEDLGNINKQAIAQGLPLEEIGRNTVVASLAQGVIERLLNKVDDAVEACTDEGK